MALGRLSSPRLLVGAYALMALTWAMSNAPFAAPDESEHYLKAVQVSSGTLSGRAARDPNPTLTAAQRAWTDQAAQSVAVPRGLSPDGFDCAAERPRVGEACQSQLPVSSPRTEVTSMGTYQPLPYLLPAAALRLAGHAPAADRLARLAGLVLWLGLVAAAILALWDGRLGPASLAGAVVAITPMVLFVGASLTGSSLEIAASLALGAGLVAATREPERRGGWALAGVAGAALCLSRVSGPLWLTCDVLMWVAWAGLPRDARGRRGAWAAGVLAALALAADRVWEAVHGPRVTVSWLPSWESLRAGARQVRDSLSQLVGRFGYLEVRLPTVALVVWAALFAGLGAAALAAGSARQRLALAGAGLGCVAVPAYLYAAVTRHTGFGLQGRHYLAPVAFAVLLAGETVARRFGRPGARWPLAVGTAAAAVQLAAWWVNARRQAVGTDGSWWFAGSASWSPPLGWWPWVALMALSAMLVLRAMSDPLSKKPLLRGVLRV